MISDALSPSRSQRLSNYIKHLPNLVAYYPLNETDGSTAYNKAPATLGTLNGSVTGATLGQAGKAGRAYSFDGVGDRVAIADNDSLEVGTGDFSFLCLVKVTDSGTVQTIVCKVDTGHTTATTAGAVGWDIIIRTDQAGNFISTRVNDGGTAVTITQNTGNDVTDGNWHLVVVTYDRDGNCVIYVDGAAVRTVSIASEALTLSNDGPMNLGCRRDTTSDFFVGLKQHSALINRLLTQTEITRIAQIAGLA